MVCRSSAMRSTTLRRMGQVCRVHDAALRQTGRLARPFGRWRLAGGAEKRVGKKSASWPRYALPENALSIPASSAIFIGIDPDVAGALGVLRVARNPHGIVLGDIKVVDMPSEIQIINRKKRRRLHVDSVIHIVQDVVRTARECPMFACLETPGCIPANGANSNRLTGYVYGVWHGVLLACGIPVEVVHATSWKRQLNLCGAGKEGSLKLARDLFPSAEKLLQRKKDHGRAEALLLAAWKSGLRVDAEDPCPTTYEEAMTQQIVQDEDEVENAPVG